MKMKHAPSQNSQLIRRDFLKLAGSAAAMACFTARAALAETGTAWWDARAVDGSGPASFAWTRIPPGRTGLAQSSPRGEARHHGHASGQFEEVASDKLGVLAWSMFHFHRRPLIVVQPYRSVT